MMRAIGRATLQLGIELVGLWQTGLAEKLRTSPRSSASSSPSVCFSVLFKNFFSSRLNGDCCLLGKASAALPLRRRGGRASKCRLSTADRLESDRFRHSELAYSELPI
jgi:hypothetical protein